MNYTTRIQDIRAFIQEQEQALLEDWFQLISHVSISETGEGVDDCCNWIYDKMVSLGLETRKYDVHPFPVLVGRTPRDPSKKPSCSMHIMM